jgi:hypothetical protein
LELNPIYLDDAMRLLERQTLTATPLRRQMRYSTKQNGHHLTFLESPSKRRHVS